MARENRKGIYRFLRCNYGSVANSMSICFLFIFILLDMRGCVPAAIQGLSWVKYSTLRNDLSISYLKNMKWQQLQHLWHVFPFAFVNKIRGE